MFSSLIRRCFGALPLALACSSALTGCIATIDESESLEGENLDGVRQAATLPYFQTTWMKGDPGNIELGKVDDYFCALSGVSGKFNGLGEEVFVYPHDGATPMWQLYGKSSADGTTGTATCYRRSDFIGTGTTKKFSAEYQLMAHGNIDCDWWDWNCPVQLPETTNTIPLWQGDAVAMLTGMAGDFAGKGELIEVRQAKQGPVHSKLAARSEVSGDHVRARAHEFLVGTPFSGLLARFVGPFGKGGPSVGEYAAGGINGLDKVRLGRRDESFCYLSHISGSFKHPDSSVKIVEDNSGYWELRVNSAGSGLTTARARCMLLDQRWPT